MRRHALKDYSLFLIECNKVQSISNVQLNMIIKVKDNLLKCYDVGKTREAIEAYKTGSKLLLDSLRCFVFKLVVIM